MSSRSLAIAEDRRRDPEWQALVDELDELREENRQLRQEAGVEARSDTWVRLKLVLGVQPGDAKMLAALFDSKVDVVSREALIVARTPAGREPPESKVLDTRLCYLRRALRPHGIEIKTVWGRGFLLSHEMKDKLRALVPELAEVRHA